MVELNKPFQKDKHGIYYIDSKDVSVTPFHFNEMNTSYEHKRDFYFIDKIDNYIIKDTTDLPKMFNSYKTKKLLKNCMRKQDLINEVDFPVGYYLDNDKIKGTIIPYYKDAISVYQLTNLYELERIKDYYLHDENKISNLIELCLDILKLLERMYEEGVIYLDLNTGNFLVYNNIIKVIDFEPNRVYFTNHNNKYLELLLNNYCFLINCVCRRFNLDKVNCYSFHDFDDTKMKVKSLYRRKGG